MTTQIAVKLPDATLDQVDRLVADGTFSSRSEAVRAGLALVVDRAREHAVDSAFATGFAAQPDTSAELRTARQLATAAIDEEPWKPWW